MYIYIFIMNHWGFHTYKGKEMLNIDYFMALCQSSAYVWKLALYPDQSELSPGSEAELWLVSYTVLISKHQRKARIVTTLFILLALNAYDIFSS